MNEHYDIFISYKRKSLPMANNLYYRLTTRGYSTFFDLEEMRKDSFDVQLFNYIENAKDVFVILEDGSLDACKGVDWEKDWFCKEIAYALKMGKNIIPILIGDYKMPPEVFFPQELKDLSKKNAPEFSFSFFEEYLNKLINKGYITSEAHAQNIATSIFKFYSNENCQVFKEGKLVCSLEGMSEEPYYLPVPRKGDYRFKVVTNKTSEIKTFNENIDVGQEKNIVIEWMRHKTPFFVLYKWPVMLCCFSIFIIVCAIIFAAYCNPRYETYKTRIIMWYKYDAINEREISHGRLYGNYEAVDLGLSVKWATRNVGADYSFNSGDFFSWGETSTKQDYSWNEYKYAQGDSIIKYCTNEQYGNVDNMSTLCPNDDVASVLWGNGWRMPSMEEANELKTKCSFELRLLNGTLGFVVTGPNKNTLFFPLAGDMSHTYREGDGLYVIFWTSTLFSDNRNAYEFSMSHLKNSWYTSTRNTGHNIRPVHE